MEITVDLGKLADCQNMSEYDLTTPQLRIGAARKNGCSAREKHHFFLTTCGSRWHYQSCLIYLDIWYFILISWVCFVFFGLNFPYECSDNMSRVDFRLTEVLENQRIVLPKSGGTPHWTARWMFQLTKMWDSVGSINSQEACYNIWRFP